MRIEKLMKNWLKITLDKGIIMPPMSWFIYGIITILLVVVYGKYRCVYINSHKDYLEDELFENSNKYGLDGWSITHLVAHMILGYLFPTTFILSQIGGIIWELFECYIGKTTPDWYYGIGFCENRLPGKDNYKVWCYGKISDIFVNILGFIIGVFLNFILLKK